MKQLVDLMENRAPEIVADALDALRRTHVQHYEAAGWDFSEARLRHLYTLALNSIRSKTVETLRDELKQMTREQFSQGFHLSELQTAFNVLEEAIWERILMDLPTSDYAEALGLISTVLGIAKDTVACSYVSLTSRGKQACIDDRLLFEGFDGDEALH